MGNGLRPIPAPSDAADAAQIEILSYIRDTNTAPLIY